VFLCEGMTWLSTQAVCPGFLIAPIQMLFSKTSWIYYVSFFLIVFGFSYLDLQVGASRFCPPRHQSSNASLLHSVSVRLVSLDFSKYRVYLLKDRDQAGLPTGRSVGTPTRRVLIGRTGFDTISSIPDLTLSLSEFLAITLL